MRRILQERRRFAKRYSIVKRAVFAWVDRLDPKTAETSNLARREFEPLALFRLRQYWVAVPWSGIKRAFQRTTKENRAALHTSLDAARSHDLSATFAGPVKNSFQRAFSPQAIRVYCPQSSAAIACFYRLCRVGDGGSCIRDLISSGPFPKEWICQFQTGDHNDNRSQRGRISFGLGGTAIDQPRAPEIGQGTEISPVNQSHPDGGKKLRARTHDASSKFGCANGR